MRGLSRPNSVKFVEKEKGENGGRKRTSALARRHSLHSRLNRIISPNRINLHHRPKRIRTQPFNGSEEIPRGAANDVVDSTEFFQRRGDGGFEGGELANVALAGETALTGFGFESRGGGFQDFVTAAEDGG